jgi:hypothetical protein
LVRTRCRRAAPAICWPALDASLWEVPDRRTARFSLKLVLILHLQLLCRRHVSSLILPNAAFEPSFVVLSLRNFLCHVGLQSGSLFFFVAALLCRCYRPQRSAPPRAAHALKSQSVVLCCVAFFRSVSCNNCGAAKATCAFVSAGCEDKLCDACFQTLIKSWALPFSQNIARSALVSSLHLRRMLCISKPPPAFSGCAESGSCVPRDLQ